MSATKYLVPDVAAAPKIEDPYPTKPVLLCVEILSPEDRPGAAGQGPVAAEQALHAGDITITLDELFAELRAR